MPKIAGVPTWRLPEWSNPLISLRMAATLVLSSGIVVHSTRSKYATFGPAVQLGVPPWRG